MQVILSGLVDRSSFLQGIEGYTRPRKLLSRRSLCLRQGLCCLLRKIIELRHRRRRPGMKRFVQIILSNITMS